MNKSYLMSAFTPSKVLQTRMHQRVMMQFAEKVGMVHFGYVDQRNDEHRLVRGLTMSSTHRDNNYCIGSFEGYDITLLERHDTIRFPGKPAKKHDWLIMTFDLQTPVDLPHIFLGLHTHGETFYAHLFTKFTHFTSVPLENLGVYQAAFLQRYALYTLPSQVLSAERMFTAEVASTILDHFGSMTLEIDDGCLYIYAEHQRPTLALLDRMLKNGMWLARVLDAQAPKL